MPTWASPRQHGHLAANISLGGAAGTGGVSLGSLTGATALPTGNLSWAGAATKTLSLVGASTFTLTGGASSTWSLTTGVLTLNAAGGINLQFGGATYADVGVTTGSNGHPGRQHLAGRRRGDRRVSLGS